MATLKQAQDFMAERIKLREARVYYEENQRERNHTQIQIEKDRLAELRKIQKKLNSLTEEEWLGVNNIPKEQWEEILSGTN